MKTGHVTIWVIQVSVTSGVTAGRPAVRFFYLSTVKDSLRSQQESFGLEYYADRHAAQEFMQIQQKMQRVHRARVRASLTK